MKMEKGNSNTTTEGWGEQEDVLCTCELLLFHVLFTLI